MCSLVTHTAQAGTKITREHMPLSANRFVRISEAKTFTPSIHPRTIPATANCAYVLQDETRVTTTGSPWDSRDIPFKPGYFTSLINELI
jgi:hypothetical protein